MADISTKPTKRAAATEYGIVLVTAGPHEGRIGEYDDDDDEGDRAIVYFGHPLIAPGYRTIPATYLTPVTTSDLMRRLEEIFSLVGLKGRVSGARPQRGRDRRVEFLTELALVQDQLADRLFQAQFQAGSRGPKVFISHSSLDKQFARWLAVDLANRGYRPWLDEWEILAGDSIPESISLGVTKCDFMVVVLSENSVESGWVGREWQAKYWDEVSAGRVQVISLLLRQCAIPPLLKTKKYADFRFDHGIGLEQLTSALSSRKRRRLTRGD
jgi:hypothetical protein